MLHGLGAETATQLLIIGAVGSTANQQSALALLLAFVGGFVVSNTAIAGLFSAGLLTAVSVRPLYFTLGILASIFSIVVGALYVFGRADCLPPIQHFWGSNGR
jgi:high-affinity nickel-transport protein